MRPWRSHGNELARRRQLSQRSKGLQCGRGGATEMRQSLQDRKGRDYGASMRPWRSHGNEPHQARQFGAGLFRFNAAVAEPRK